jgi:uncharacterized protein YdhG (YjbR/CyaY superfamily)
MDTKEATVEEYISRFPQEVQDRLRLIRNVIKENAPDAMETISYGMPAYKLNKKPLVYFAGYAKHIGLYATPSGHDHFKQELSVYKQGKGSVQFPLDQSLPIDLIAKIVQFRVLENTK